MNRHAMLAELRRNALRKRKKRTAAGWRRYLQKLQVTWVWYQGGRLRVRYQLPDGQPTGDGIQSIGKDHVSIATEDRLYFIPFAALKRVVGARAPELHPVRIRRTLSSVVSQWVDPQVDPDAPDQILWHRFVSRRGEEYAGAVTRIHKLKGVRLRLIGGRILWLPWKRIGAAVELRE